MNSLSKQAFLAALLACSASQASLAGDGLLGGIGVYGGATAGPMINNSGSLQNSQNYGFVGGYAFGDTGMAMEAMYTSDLLQGDIDTTAGGKWDTDAYAFHGVYRYGETMYVKAKGGYASVDVNITANYIIPNSSESGFSAGIGGGMRIGEVLSVEGEYTLLSSDVSYLSASLLVQF